MAHESEFPQAIAELKKNNEDITFAELIHRVYNNRLVEVYVGEEFENVKLEEVSFRVPAVLIGKVIAAYNEMLVLNCAFVDRKTKKIRFGNIVSLNERAVRTIAEVDDSGDLRDTFLNSSDAKLIRDLINENKK